MDVLTTITKPWRDPVSYVSLAFWVMIFAIVAFALHDSLRVVASYAKGAV